MCVELPNNSGRCSGDVDFSISDKQQISMNEAWNFSVKLATQNSMKLQAKRVRINKQTRKIYDSGFSCESISDIEITLNTFEGLSDYPILYNSLFNFHFNIHKKILLSQFILKYFKNITIIMTC